MAGKARARHGPFEGANELRDQANKFADKLGDARKEAKSPGRFWPPVPRARAGVADEILFLRRWNSHTPALTGGWGGGYFLRWQKKGTVIDPGCTFLGAFARFGGYSLDNVNAIIATHDHADHCHDLALLVSALREFNKWRIEAGEPPHLWDLLLSHGVHSQYQSLLYHPENAPFLTVRKILPPATVDHLRELPDYVKKARTKNWPRHLSSLRVFHRRRRTSREYCYKLFCTPTRHRELLGDRTGFGVKLQLLKPRRRKGTPPAKVIAFSSDTAVSSTLPGLRARDFAKTWHDWGH